jgi:nucleoside-diphosphate-sugar epimerase
MVEALTHPAAVVLGASSQIGWFLLPRLVASGYSVAALSRTGQPEHYPALPQVRWIQSLELRQTAGHASAVLSAGPLELVPAILDSLPSLTKVVAFSTTSVLTKEQSPDPVERETIHKILQAEERLRETCRRRGVALCLLRPTLVYGCGQDANVTRLARLIVRLPRLPVCGAAKGLRQPVHADDLAAAAVAALEAGSELPRELILCGGSTLPYLEMLERIARASGRSLRPLHLTENLMSLGLRMLGKLPGFGDISPAMARRQNQDLVFDDAPARAVLGYRPRSFEPDAADLETPHPGRILALARVESPVGE